MGKWKDTGSQCRLQQITRQWVIFPTLFIRFLSRTKQKSIQDLTKYEASKLSSNLVRFPYPYTVHGNEPDMSMGNEIRFYSHCKMSDDPE